MKTLINYELLGARLNELYGTRRFRVGMCTTGAAAGIGALMWSTPGASSTLASFNFPYHRSGIDVAAGGSPGKYLSMGAANRLATSAFLSAQQSMVEDNAPSIEPIGLGASAAVQTNRERKGADEIFIAVRNTHSFWELHVAFTKGTFGREEQGQLCDLLCLNAVLAVAGIAQVPMPASPHWSSPQFQPVADDAGFVTLRLTPSEVVVPDGELTVFDEHGKPASVSPAEVIYYPMSCKPFHYGHDGFARLAAGISGKRVVHGIGIKNADKGNDPEAAGRLVQLRGRYAALMRGVDLFRDMHLKFGFKMFLAGADTADRILNPAYYNGDPQGVAGVIDGFRRDGVQFFIAPRRDPASGKMLWLSAPPQVADIFVPLSGMLDVSSSKIRSLMAGTA